MKTASSGLMTWESKPILGVKIRWIDRDGHGFCEGVSSSELGQGWGELQACIWAWANLNISRGEVKSYTTIHKFQIATLMIRFHAQISDFDDLLMLIFIISSVCVLYDISDFRDHCFYLSIFYNKLHIG